MGTDKGGVRIGGRTLLERVIDAVVGVVDRVVVVAPEVEMSARADWPDVSFVLEDPPFGGPVAGLAAGVASVTAGEVLVLAVDLARPDAVVGLLGTIPPGRDGLVLVDPDGWPQYLAGRYATAGLRSRLVGGVRDVSVRRALAGLNLAHVAADREITADMDSPADLPDR